MRKFSNCLLVVLSVAAIALSLTSGGVHASIGDAPWVLASALAITHPTLLDVTKRLDPDGNIAKIVEMLNQTNPVIEDAVFIEGNGPTKHRTTIRTGIPTPTWRKLYGGVQPARSTTRQVDDSIGMLESYAEVDKSLADLNGNTAEFRMSEERPHIEGMNQEFASTLFYGNEGTEPEAFTGLSPRYNSLSAENADNIVDAFSGSGGDLTSIWLVVWGKETAHCFYPKGGKGGLQMNDKGQVTLESANGDGTGGRMEAYRTHYKWDCGFSLRDWRYVARTANIDISELSTLANTKNIITWMVQMAERIPAMGMGRPVFYMNRTIREKLRLGILEKIATNLTWETVAGKRVMTFDDIEVHRTDALLNTESRVV